MFKRKSTVFPSTVARLLGPSTAQDVIQLTTGQALNHQGIRDARLLVMDAATVSTYIYIQRIVLFSHSAVIT
jgi:hypothetical protein